MARAETLYGCRETRSEDYVFALADTGVGVALMINGAPYVGPNQLAGEIGHVPVPGATLPCSCGNTGCLETVASVSAVLEQVERRLSESSVVSVLRDAAGPFTIHTVIKAAEAGDKLAYQVVMDAGEKFGYGLALTANLFGPQRIIVGGALSASPLYMESARRAVRLQALGKLTGSLEVQASTLDHLAGARGAASLVLNEVFQEGRENLLTLGKSDTLPRLGS
jgi:N-acetylglucosamine repressor